MRDERNNAESRLQIVSENLAEITGQEPLELAEGGSRSLQDRLWVWGIVGGKNVGKSTLINALAGSDVVDRGEDVGEGTTQPEVYLASEDFQSVRNRFAELPSVPIGYHEDAPASMRGLALVDLPDFDSLFTDHVETVRAIASRLDGIIWVTTPKKVGDLRAINEVRRVLKARTNFAYVVNKMDWLLAQTSQDPVVELRRAADALQTQITECDGSHAADRSFMIAARYPSADTMAGAIRESRKESTAAPDGTMKAAVDQLIRDFGRLRQTLTTAPTAEVAETNKLANLDFQVRAQAEQIRGHYHPEILAEKLQRATDEDAVYELIRQHFSQDYCARLVENLNSGRELFAEWSSQLFRQRIAHWPLLGWIAWPVMAAGGAIAGLRTALPSLQRDRCGDLFRLDGIDLAQRVDGLLVGFRARLARVRRHMNIEITEAADLENRFRRDVMVLADRQRSAVIAPYLSKKPGIVGRALRGILPLAVLLWFPLVQPVLAMVGELSLTEAAGGLIHALSGSNVLSGLAVSLLILSGLVAGVYSRVVRDTAAALETLQSIAAEGVSESLQETLAGTVTASARRLLARLEDLCQELKHFERSSPDAHAP